MLCHGILYRHAAEFGLSPAQYMSSSTGKLAGFSLPVPNETRLQELYALAQRKQVALPGPGAYEVARSGGSCGSHRRPQQPQLDGPFLLRPGQPSLRCQHISRLLLLQDSGQAPGAYDGPASKDATSALARAPTPKFGTGSRAGSAAVSADKLCLSLSRSISSGLNWARPVPLKQLQQHLGSPREALAAAAAAHKAATNHGVQQAAHLAACAAEPCTAPHSRQQDVAGGEQQQLLQQETATAAAAAPRSPPASGSSLPPGHGRRAASGRTLPWQLAKSITEWQHVAQALKQQQPQPQQQQQQRMPTQLNELCSEEAAAQAAWRSSRSTVMLEEQQVLQHTSAARAAATVVLLAERRQKWQVLSNAT